MVINPDRQEKKTERLNFSAFAKFMGVNRNGRL